MKISENLSTGEATGAHLTGALGQGVLYLLPELSLVLKCLLEEILNSKYVDAFQLSAIFQGIFFVFKI